MPTRRASTQATRSAHLPGALHLPLQGLSESSAHDVLDTHRPVIAYCNDFL